MKRALGLALIAALAICLGACASDPETTPDEEEVRKPSLQDLLEAARDDPDDYEAQVALGMYYFRFEQRYNLARLHYERALEIAGRQVYTHPHYMLGHCYRELKEFDQALREWEDCFQVPEEKEGDYLSDVYYRLCQYWSTAVLAEGQGEPDGAQSHIDRFHERGGDLSDEINLYGIVAWSYAFRKKDPEKASHYLKRFREGQVPDVRLELKRRLVSARDIQREIDRLRGEETAHATPAPAE